MTRRIFVLLLSAAVLCFAGLILSGCKTPSSETVKVLDQTLDTLTEHGVDYDFEISGQMEGEVWARQAFGAGTPGWVRVRVRSPNMNLGTNGL